MFLYLIIYDFKLYLFDFAMMEKKYMMHSWRKENINFSSRVQKLS